MTDANPSSAFQAWLADAKPGDRFEYYRGFLAKERAGQGATSLNILADVVWANFLAGRVTLSQRRHGNDDYSYYAIITTRQVKRHRLWPAVEARTGATHVVRKERAA